MVCERGAHEVGGIARSAYRLELICPWLISYSENRKRGDHEFMSGELERCETVAGVELLAFNHYICRQATCPEFPGKW